MYAKIVKFNVFLIIFSVLNLVYLFQIGVTNLSNKKLSITPIMVF